MGSPLCRLSFSHGDAPPKAFAGQVVRHAFGAPDKRPDRAAGGRHGRRPCLGIDVTCEKMRGKGSIIEVAANFVSGVSSLPSQGRRLRRHLVQTGGRRSQTDGRRLPRRAGQGHRPIQVEPLRITVLRQIARSRLRGVKRQCLDHAGLQPTTAQDLGATRQPVSNLRAKPMRVACAHVGRRGKHVRR